MDYFKCFQDSVNELKEIREYESLNTLSKAIGIHQTTLSKWLTGKCYPTLNYAVKLADFFDCSLDYLFGLSDDSTFTKAKSQATFLERFTELSEKSGLTDYAIAKRVKTKPGTIAKWRYRGNIPQMPKLIKLTEIFNCSLDYLAGRSDNL